MKNETFGVKIKKLRNAKYMTQTQMANEVGVSLRTVQHWEYTNALPKKEDTLNKIADLFGINKDYLLDDTHCVSTEVILPQQVQQVVIDAQQILDNPRIPCHIKDLMSLKIVKYYVEQKLVNLEKSLIKN